MSESTRCLSRNSTFALLVTVCLSIHISPMLLSCSGSQGTRASSTQRAPAVASSALDSQVDETGTSIEQLFANGPCPQPEARQFDFWHGLWDVVNRQANPSDPTNPTLYDTGVANKLGYSVVGGCMNVEHWQGLLSWGRVLGINLRWYDVDAREWVLVSTWPGNSSPKFSTMRGSFDGAEGRLRSSRKNAQGQTTRSLFVITGMDSSSPRWEQRLSSGADETWKTIWIMEFHRRRPDTHSPLFIGPVQGQVSSPRCDRPEARGFDFLVGEWHDASRRTGGTSVHAYSILDGCAVMDFMEFVGPPTNDAVDTAKDGVTDHAKAESFRVRLYDPALGKWVQYGLDTENTRLRRLEGTVQENAIVFTSVDHEGTNLPVVRERWETADSKKISWQREQSTDGGASWRVTNTATLTHRGGR